MGIFPWDWPPSLLKAPNLKRFGLNGKIYVENTT
jgi:hypothetical protein